MLVGVTAILAMQVFEFFTRLSGMPWIWCYAIALAFAALGVSLIFYTKLPLYLQGRFLTFGSRALPEGRRSFYR
jgi:cell division protein FtsW (lipid II flippase)